MSAEHNSHGAFTVLLYSGFKFLCNFQEEQWSANVFSGSFQDISFLGVLVGDLWLVIIATVLWAGWSVVRILLGGRRFFSSPECPCQLGDLPSFLYRRYLLSFLDVKWIGHEVSQSSLSTGFRISGDVLLLTPYALMACRLKTFNFPVN